MSDVEIWETKKNHRMNNCHVCKKQYVVKDVLKEDETDLMVANKF